MNILENANLGRLILRLMVGGLMLFHGYAKLIHGVGFIEQTLINAGLPGYIAYGVYIGEIVAPIFLIIGLQVRLSALVIIFTMINAIVLVNLDKITSVTQHGAWAIEVPMFYLLSSLAIVFLGAGRYTLVNR